MRIKCTSIGSNEHGASSILVGLLMVALLGFAAISVDVGKLYWEKAQLQNGADAGALALASICGIDESDPGCVETSGVPPQLADENANDATSRVPSIKLDTANNKVTVVTAGAEPGSPTSTVSTWFARILDPAFSDVEVGATATAVWAPPPTLISKFPLAFSKCEVDSIPPEDDALSELRFLRSKGKDPDEYECSYNTSSGLELEGGFGWLVGAGCSATTTIGESSQGVPGNSKPSACEDTLIKWKKDLKAGKQVVVLLPVFDDSVGTSEKTYNIYAYAAFEVHGWKFSTGVWDYRPADVQAVIDAYQSTVNGGAPEGFVGKFIRYVFDDEDTDFGEDDTNSPDLGANVIQLVE